MSRSEAITDDLIARMGNPKAALESLIFRAIFADEAKRYDYLRAAFFDFGHPVEGLEAMFAADEQRLLKAAIWTNRRRLLHLLQIIQPRPDKFIVDMGCGCGGLAFHLAKAGARVLGLDRDEAVVGYGRRLIAQFGGRVRLALGDCRSIPLPAASADKIVCANVFEHVMAKEDVLHEFCRVLKPGGWLYIYTDNFTHVRLRVRARRLQGLLTSRNLRSWRVGYSGEEGGHVALITPSTTTKLLRELGFSVKVVYSLPDVPVLGRLVSRFFCAVAYKPLGQREVA